MKKTAGIKEELSLDKDIKFSLDSGKIVASKDNKRIERKIPQKIDVKLEDNMVKISTKRNKKSERKLVGTLIGHIKNMEDGLKNGFEYELEICNVHFPMTVTFDKAKKEFVIKNLLGEKAPRIVKSAGEVEVEIKAPKIKIKGYDIESAGQTAANLERISKIRNRDRNKFQDGIFITKKPGKSHLD